MRLNNETINKALRELRDQIREGKITVHHAFPDNFKRIVVAALGVELSSEFLNPQTVRRLTTLLSVPLYGSKWPSQDQTAWAIQNFINRRSYPWSHVLKSTPFVDPLAASLGA